MSYKVETTALDCPKPSFRSFGCYAEARTYARLTSYAKPSAYVAVLDHEGDEIVSFGGGHADDDPVDPYTGGSLIDVDEVVEAVRHTEDRGIPVVLYRERDEANASYWIHVCDRRDPSLSWVDLEFGGRF